MHICMCVHMYVYVYTYIKEVPVGQHEETQGEPRQTIQKQCLLPAHGHLASACYCRCWVASLETEQVCVSDAARHVSMHQAVKPGKKAGRQASETDTISKPFSKLHPSPHTIFSCIHHHTLSLAPSITTHYLSSMTTQYL